MRLGHPRLNALLVYDEVEGRARERTRRHLAGCPECRGRLAAARGIRIGAAEVTAPPLPGRVWERIQESLSAGEGVILPELGSPAAGLHRDRRSYPKVAALLLLGGAGGAAAASLVSPVAELLRGAGPETVAVESPPPRSAGVAVPVPAAGLRVRILDAHPELRLRVTLVDRDLLEVVGSGGAADAVFRSGGGVLTIAGPAAGELRLAVPRSAASVVLEIDGREVLTSDGTTLVLLGDPVAGPEVLLRLPQPLRPMEES